MEAIRTLVDVKDRTVTFVLPQSFTSRRVEVIVLPAPDAAPQPAPAGARRRPSPLLADTVIVGDLMAPSVPDSDWDALK